MISKAFALERIEEFRKLESNWDSYDAYPITEQAISTAIEIITGGPENGLLWVSPSPNGGIDMEYMGTSNKGRIPDLMYEIDADGSVDGYKVTRTYEDASVTDVESAIKEAVLWTAGLGRYE